MVYLSQRPTRESLTSTEYGPETYRHRFRPRGLPRQRCQNTPILLCQNWSEGQGPVSKRTSYIYLLSKIRAIPSTQTKDPKLNKTQVFLAFSQGIDKNKDSELCKFQWHEVQKPPPRTMPTAVPLSAALILLLELLRGRQANSTPRQQAPRGSGSGRDSLHGKRRAGRPSRQVEGHCDSHSREPDRRSAVCTSHCKQSKRRSGGARPRAGVGRSRAGSHFICLTSSLLAHKTGVLEIPVFLTSQTSTR